MNILIVTQYFWPENFRINDLVLGLKEKEHTVSVLTGKPNYPAGKFFPGYSFFKKSMDNFDGVTIYRIPVVPRGNGRNLRLILNYLSFIFFGCLLSPFLLKQDYDLIFVYEPSPITVMIPAILLKKIKNAPIMLWVLDLWPESISATSRIKSSFIMKAVGWLVHFIYNHCEWILVQSQAFIPSIEKYGIKKQKIVYFPNSAEELFYPSYKVNPEIDAKLPRGLRIMFAGNIGVAQNFETILAAAEFLKDNKDIHFIILGIGRMYNWTRDEIKSRGLNGTVHLMGQYPLEQMNDYFSCADVMLVTLKRNQIFSLTIPGKVQSYMACGRPIIAALDGEGGRLVKESGAGFTCPSEDPLSLAAAIMKFYELPVNEREKMGSSGRKYYEQNFERNMLLNKLNTLFHSYQKS